STDQPNIEERMSPRPKHARQGKGPCEKTVQYHSQHRSEQAKVSSCNREDADKAANIERRAFDYFDKPWVGEREHARNNEQRGSRRKVRTVIHNATANGNFTALEQR